MNLYSMIKGVLLAVIFLALMVGILPQQTQLVRMGGSGWFLIGQNVEQTGSCHVTRAS
ncbi:MULTISPECIES: hypothetical protein [Pseudomonas]|jgi:hypothetical protein|uniref:Uncharacterized protein n=1 Tax=Pseudomonas fluorescens TaxID=294 RepID=A0A109LLX7_PSEFL|nr:MULTISPECIES: hypothetical protein [Pseudomonas]KWV89860.1 hypothetical protein PFLmoz3_00490 [Pseudomonas fluorescens]MBA1255069.1 hypothetical protein [Pseudomonas carnis]MBA1269306.1 hypothetical protein [Pseudomonas carnis]MBA1300750.1 hypothetical protein [Pseudomonas carnis]MBI6656667.1 hypothetical protein [Pseudomonas carnis]